MSRTDASYSLDFDDENDDNDVNNTSLQSTKSETSQSYTSIQSQSSEVVQEGSSKSHPQFKGSNEDGREEIGVTRPESQKILLQDVTSGDSSKQDKNIDDLLAALSVEEDQYDEASFYDEMKSTASQPLSNAIEMYEELSKAGNSSLQSLENHKSSTEISDIDEIIKQLEQMEKIRDKLEKYSEDGNDDDSLSLLLRQGPIKSKSKPLGKKPEAHMSEKSQPTATAQSSKSDTLISEKSRSELSEKYDQSVKISGSEQEVNSISSKNGQAVKSVMSSNSSEKENSKNEVTKRPAPAVLKPFDQKLEDNSYRPDETSISEISEKSKRSNKPIKRLEKSQAQFQQYEYQPQATDALQNKNSAELEDEETRRYFITNSRSMDSEISGRQALYSQPNSNISAKQHEKGDLKLKSELVRQNSLISAYQKEIENLYKQMKTEKEQFLNIEKKFTEEKEELKTEIARLKVSNRVAVLPNSPRKGELDKLKEELNLKSMQIGELRQEITRLQIEIKHANSLTDEHMKQCKSSGITEEKEKEYQKNIRNLEKQVRTLQKLAFHKQPPEDALQLSAKSNSRLNLSFDEASTQTFFKSDELNTKQCTILEYRVSELENELMKADEDAKEKVQEFEERFMNLKGKYEQRISELEVKVKNLRKEKESFELQTHELSQQLTLARTQNKQEKQKPTPRLSAGSKQTSSLSGVVVITQDKEKEYQKSIKSLEKQVRTLQKLAFHKGGGDSTPKQNICVDNVSTQTLPVAMEEINKVQPMKSIQCARVDNDSNEDAKEKVRDFEDRLVTLKGKFEQRIFDLEEALRNIKQEKEELEFRNRDLHQQLTLARTLNKPEREILRELMEKVETLNFRYNYREQQIGTLLNWLSVKCISPLTFSTTQNGQKRDSIAILAELNKLCPTTDIHLTDL